MNQEAWLQNLEITEETQYRQIELFLQGQTKKGFARISEDKQSMTLLFHDHKNKWSISKEPISAQLLFNTKEIPKSVFDYIVNQNLSNL